MDLTKHYGSAGRDEASGVATTSAGVILAGMFDGKLTLGGAAPSLTSLGALDVFVAKLAFDGTPAWAVRFGGAAGEDRDPHIAVDAAGDIYVTGQFRGQVAFGAVNLIAKGGADIFVAKLRGDTGAVAWAIGLGSVGDDGSRAIAVDGQGHLVIAATLAGPLDGGVATAGLDAALLSFEASSGARAGAGCSRRRATTAAGRRSTAATATCTPAPRSPARSISAARCSGRRTRPAC